EAYAQEWGVRRTVPEDAVDGILLSGRGCLDFGASSEQWLRQRVADLPEPLPELPDPGSPDEDHAADRCVHAGADRRPGVGMLRQGIRHQLPCHAAEPPRQTSKGGLTSDAGGNGRDGATVRRA